MKWLITAFEPFAGSAINSSLQVMAELKALHLSDRLVFHAPVPVSFAKAWPDVKQRAESIDDLAGVLSLGQAETRRRIGLERVALNWNDAGLADNDGLIPPQGKIHCWAGCDLERYSVGPIRLIAAYGKILFGRDFCLQRTHV